MPTYDPYDVPPVRPPTPFCCHYHVFLFFRPLSYCDESLSIFVPEEISDIMHIDFNVNNPIPFAFGGFRCNVRCMGQNSEDGKQA